MTRVYGSGQFEVEWSAPSHVEYLDIVQYDDNGNPLTITKSVPTLPEPEAPLTPEALYTRAQQNVVFVEHDNGATRVVPKEGK